MPRIKIIVALLSCLACRTNSTRFSDQQGAVNEKKHDIKENDDLTHNQNQDHGGDFGPERQLNADSSLQLEPAEILIRYQEKIRVKAFLVQKGKKIDVSKEGEWLSSNQAQVSVDQTGLVTGIKLGCNVTFKYQGTLLTVPVVVNPKPIVRLQYGSLQIKPNSSEQGQGSFRFRLENIKETDAFEINTVFSSDFNSITKEFMPFVKAQNYGHREFVLSFKNTFNTDTASYENQILNIKILFNPDSSYEFQDIRALEQKIVDDDNNVLSSGPNHYFEGTEGYFSKH